MVFTYINPAVAVAAGVVLLGEPFTTAMVAAFALIIAGCALATARPGGPLLGNRLPRFCPRRRMPR
jgi:drug/metabolite transporter (DMT)-like permease